RNGPCDREESTVAPQLARKLRRRLVDPRGRDRAVARSVVEARACGHARAACTELAIVKGKLVERRGRKATGLTVARKSWPKIAGLPKRTTRRRNGGCEARA